MTSECAARFSRSLAEADSSMCSIVDLLLQTAGCLPTSPQGLKMCVGFAACSPTKIMINKCFENASAVTTGHQTSADPPTPDHPSETDVAQQHQRTKCR